MARSSIIYRFLNMYWWGLGFALTAFFMLSMRYDLKAILDLKHEAKGPYMTDQFIDYAIKAIVASVIMSAALLLLHLMNGSAKENGNNNHG